jgi:hypothetical protein
MNANRCTQRNKKSNCYLGEGFLLQIVTGNKTWVHHSEPKSNWPYNTPKEKKSKSVLPAGKINVTVLWGKKVFSPYFLPKGTTVNSDCYIGTLKSLNAHLQVCPTSKLSEVLLIHGNTGSYANVCTTEVIINFDWIVLPHPLYSHDPAPSDYYHLFGPLKKSM